ncbi:hypothetical protein M8C21_006131 [Ambrosia artemisiifolia]|uniref:Exportin-1 C-terminal domain-containing protein n=1 Tax=Ambrosia artemisiifolia TaxID=4212 RepID=A0AAD5G2T5_AMBAR|nr:hypothetical protein M8C21_006131 [Ambrosia artemisiifolia]
MLIIQRTSADHIWKELQVKPDMRLQMVHTDRQSLKTKIFALQGPESLIKDRRKAMPVEHLDGMKNFIADVNVKHSSFFSLLFLESKQMLDKLHIQMNGEDWSMMEHRDNKFLLDLLKFCQTIIGKDNKSAIASNIMNVIGQYPRFLKAHQKFLEPVDMACNTFLKILQTCKRKFVILQVEESEPHQIPTFYDPPESEAAKQKEFLLRLMNRPTQKRTKMIFHARGSVDFFFHAEFDTDVIRTLLNMLQQLKLVMDSVLCAFQDTETNNAETRVNLLLEMLKNFQSSVFGNQFYYSLLVLIVQELFSVLTDTFHKPGFKFHVLVLQHLFCLDNKDLHEEEAASQKEKDRQPMHSIPGLTETDKIQDEMVKEAMKRLEGSLKQIDEMKATTQEALNRADVAVAAMNVMAEELRRLRIGQAIVESLILPKTQIQAPLPSTEIHNHIPPHKLKTKHMFLKNFIQRFQRRKS